MVKSSCSKKMLLIKKLQSDYKNKLYPNLSIYWNWTFSDYGNGKKWLLLKSI